MKKLSTLAAIVAAASSSFGQMAANPVGWWKADAGVTTDGAGNVINWGDSSGNGHDASGGTAPTLMQGAINGLPAVQFNGSAQLPIAGQVLSSDQLTILAVVTDALPDSGFHEIFSNWSSSTFEQSVFLGTANLNPRRVRFSDQVGGATDPTHTQTGVGALSNPTSPFVLSARSDVSAIDISQNGGSIYTANYGLSNRNFGDVYRLGSQGGNFEFWNGLMGEVIVYDRALTDTEYANTEQYLYNKWIAPVPEPASLAAVGLGALALLARRRVTAR